MQRARSSRHLLLSRMVSCISCLEWKNLRSFLNGYPLRFAILFNRIATAFPTPTTVFPASEGTTCIRIDGAVVDVHHTGFQSFGQVQGLVYVLGYHAGR